MPKTDKINKVNKMSEMPKVIKVRVDLTGALAEFGDQCQVMAATPAAAISAVATMQPAIATALRRGRYYLYDATTPDTPPLMASVLASPLTTQHLRLVPEIAGANRGRGKALLGLTLLGLSFVPGVNQAVGSGFARVGQSLGSDALATTLGEFGSQLLGRSGALLMLSGAVEMLAPQDRNEAGNLTSASLTPPRVTGQGAAIPLVYGETTIQQPIIISSGLHIESE